MSSFKANIREKFAELFHHSKHKKTLQLELEGSLASILSI